MEDNKEKYIVYEDMFETSTNLIRDIENIIEENKKNNNSSSGSSGFYDDEKDWFFNKNYYLVPLKDINNQLKYNGKMEYYSDSNKGLDRLIKSFRDKMPTKIIVGAMLKGGENRKINKIMANNIIVKQKDKKQELYLDVAIMSPEYMNNIKKMMEEIMATIRREVDIHKQNAIKKYQEIMFKQQQKKIIDKKVEAEMKEKDRIIKEKLDVVSSKAKQKINSVLNIIKKFLHLFANKPTKVVDDFVEKMNKDFQLPVSISLDKDVNFDQKIAECSGKLIQEGLKFIRGAGTGLKM